jgi:serine protease inhibitor
LPTAIPRGSVTKIEVTIVRSSNFALRLLAAAATGIGGTEVAAPQYAITVDHPFFYAIQDDKTGELLFIGVLMNPS